MNKLTGTFDPSHNPVWPPAVNTFIITSNNKDIFIGKVIYQSFDTNTVLLHLAKSFYNTSNASNIPNIQNLPNIPNIPNIQNIPKNKQMYVSSTWGWRYTTIPQITKFLESDNNKRIPCNELVYDDIRNGESTIGNKYYGSSINKGNNKKLCLNKVINIDDMDDFAFLTRMNEIDVSGINYTESIHEYDYDIEDLIPDKVKGQRKNIIMMLENNITDSDTDNDELMLKAKKSNTPQDILVTDQSMITKYVDNKDTLKLEADKLIRYFRESLRLEGSNAEINDEKLYESVRFVYYDNYIHIFREGIPVKEIITHELLGDDEDNPKLKILNDEYDKPIRYDILKHLLFQNKTQKSFKTDNNLRSDAELILSQEYILALTPEPRYQLWCVMRLIRLWYGDIDLQNNIRKIKFIINQYRCRSDQKFNIRNGIRFSIGIYPRYGKKSASIVLKKLMYYFSTYIQAIGWKKNPSSYFKIVNDLISYSNSNQILKLYYKNVAREYGQQNEVFNKNFTLVNDPRKTDIMERYIKL